MNILALDTATSSCSAALWKNGGVRSHRLRAMAHGQSEALMGMVQDVLAEAACGFAELDLLAVTTGPGSFTGLRVGLAAARGLALARNLPCLGVTTLETVAHQVSENERAGKTLLVLLESKRDDIYAQTFSAGLEPLSAPEAVNPNDLVRLVSAAPTLIVGDAAERGASALAQAGVKATISNAPGVPDAATAAMIAAMRWRPGDKPPPPVPLYLRPPDAVIPKNGGRIRP